MDNVISRQAAIDVAIQSIMDWDGMFIQDANCRISNAINELPSAEPKRVKGRWIEMSSYMNHTYKCSECGRLLVNVTDGKNNVSKHYPYCHCGADMRGEDGE